MSLNGAPVSSSITSRSPRWWVGALHLFALSGFAIAWPLFDTLSRNGSYFIARGMTGRDLVTFALTLIVVPPALLTAIVNAVRAISGSAAGFVQAFFAGLLATLTIGRPLSNALPGSHPLHNLLYLSIIALAAVAYHRLALVRRFATFLAPAPLIFLVLFLAFGPMSVFFREPRPVEQVDRDRADTSVIFLLLDEASLGSLLDTDGSIDERRFPNFARLGERSTWYPNATTNSNATLYAMPTILTGNYPKGGTKRPLPVAQVYPNNLFTVLEPSHRLQVEEWMSAMCALDSCRERRRERTGLKDLIADTSLVLAHMSLPETGRRWLPEFGLQWGRFVADPVTLDERVERFPGAVQSLIRPVMELAADEEARSYEVRRFDSFVQSIRPPEKPTVWFLHAALPHFPWHLLPDQRAYDDQTIRGMADNGFWLDAGAADRTLQRYLLQLKATDALLGDLMSRIGEQGMWDETMFVVQADHGVSFKEGRALRSISGAEDELLPIPLFVKFPGQKEGRIDRRNAELIDITPTIADVLDVNLPWKFDGRSLRAKDPPRRPKRAWEWGQPLAALERGIANRGALPDRITALFGEARREDDLFAWGPHRALLGRSLRSLETGMASGARATVERRHRYRTVNVDAPWLPARMSGTLHGTTRWAWVGVAVNGKLAGLGRPYLHRGEVHFSIMLSPRYFVEGANDIAIVGIGKDGTLSQIRI